MVILRAPSTPTLSVDLQRCARTFKEGHLGAEHFPNAIDTGTLASLRREIDQTPEEKWVERPLDKGAYTMAKPYSFPTLRLLEDTFMNGLYLPLNEQLDAIHKPAAGMNSQGAVLMVINRFLTNGKGMRFHPDDLEGATFQVVLTVRGKAKFKVAPSLEIALSKEGAGPTVFDLDSGSLVFMTGSPHNKVNRRYSHTPVHSVESCGEERISIVMTF